MKRKKFIIMAAAFSGFLFCLAKGQAVSGTEGWREQGGYWNYMDENGRPVTDSWKESGGDWYYLDSAGRLASDRLISAEGGLFYVDQTGRRVKNGWVQADSQSPDRKETAWYYFGDGGRAYMGRTGVKRLVEGKYYVFDEKGRMLTGWFDEAGKPLSEEDSPIRKGTYYAGEDGALWGQEWMNYSSMPESISDRLESGIDGINYRDYKGLWLYFDQNCRRVKGALGQSRQKVIEGSTYGFDENGVMLAWWDGQSGAAGGSKTGEEPVRFYSAYNGGKLLRDTWFWMYPSEGMDQRDYENEAYHWWHTDEKGEVYRDRIKKLDGKSYAFDKLGRMQTGFVLYQGRRNFVAQYNLDVWTSEQFKRGEVLGIEGADLYLFGPDELNDGSMQVGEEKKVELADGVFTFGFGRNGIAYGNGNKVQKVKESYYINGLRLEANENNEYGVVEVKEGEYKVVDKRGKIIKGERRILKEFDGSWLLMLNGRFMAQVREEERPRWERGAEGWGYYRKGVTGGKQRKELITQYGSPPAVSGLSEEERVYIQE